MKKSFKRLLTIILLVTFCSLTRAQIYDIKNYTVENGLAQAQILSIYQDKEGKMWFGSNNSGISVLDGKNFSYISDKEGLPDNVIFSITGTKNGKVWIGTNNGVAIYEKNNVKVFNRELNHSRVFKVFEDKEGKVWLGTGKGVNVFDKGNLNVFMESEALSNSSVFNIIQDSKGRLIFCTMGDGVFIYDGKEISHFNESNGLRSGIAYGVIEKSENVLWLFTHKGMYQLKDQKITEVFPNSKSSEEQFYEALKTDKDIIWIASGKGIYKFSNNEFKLINSKNGLVHNNIWKIYQDREKNLWCGSRENGVSKFKGDVFSIINENQGLAKNVVNSIGVQADNKLIVGTDYGISIISKGKITNYTPEKIESTTNQINFVLSENKKDIWVGSNFGLYKFLENKFYTVPVSNKYNDYNRIYYIHKEDSQVLLGTYAGLGKVENNQIIPAQDIGIPKTPVYSILKDKDENYWFGTDEGVFISNKQKGLFKKFTQADNFTEKRVRAIKYGINNDIWFGTTEGLFRYKDGEFEKFDQSKGISENNIYSLLIDKKGTVYIGLPNGFDKIEFKDQKIYRIKNYKLEDGFLGQECSYNAAAIDENGLVYLGTRNGLVVYNPDLDYFNYTPPIANITSVKLFSQITDWNEFSERFDDQGFPVNLKLSYDKNYFTFEFIGVSHTVPEKVRYSYRLLGLDKDWLPVTEKTEATYSNLPHGEYEFQLIACNNDGIWNEEPVSFSFEILPPFWKTGWFYSIIALIVAGFVFSYFKVQTANRKISHQNEIIEEKNIDLENANKEIAETNKNITDSINYAKRIQDAILPAKSKLYKYLPNSFILFNPKDIVSGDFYWVQYKNGLLYIAVVDCTGHGVPGAFMSIVGYNGLTRALNEFNLSKPSDILDKLNVLVEDTLHQNDQTWVQDGMDIALCCIDLENNKLSYSGANNSLWMVRSKEHLALSEEIKFNKLVINDKEVDFDLYELKADKQPIGAFDNKFAFTSHDINLLNDDAFYLFTDGYADQFGGKSGKKFKYKPFKELILNNASKTMSQQGKVIEKALIDWKGDYFQVDDICVLGFRIKK